VSDDGSIKRRPSRKIIVGGRNGRIAVPIGGDSPISVQSMIKRRPDDIISIINDCIRLQDAGCDIIRITIPDEEAAKTLPAILAECRVPIVADIHFSTRAALAAIESGADKIRLNPGNLPRSSDVQIIARECKRAGVPIRVGVNSGSLPKDLLLKYEGDRVSASVEGALRHIEMLKDVEFNDIVVAIKSSHTDEMIRSNRLLASQTDCPIHLGVTEAGCAWEGNIRSAIGIGALLSQGIGDTIRVSLTDDAVEEVKTGIEILRSLSLREPGITFISCPTCGRLEADIRPVVTALRDRLAHLNHPLRVAIMGCAVNGPGEAAGSDICLLAGKDRGVIYRGETVIRTVPVDSFIDEMEKEILSMFEERYGL
jgi:(E)-4-hydroxy-3-methylbut-2-enyl-diphosphate synthase